MKSSAILCLSLVCGASRALPVSSQAGSIGRTQEADVSEIASQAVAALQQGDFAGAIRGFEKLVKLAPHVPEFHANLGLAYYSVGRFREAVPECREAYKLKPQLTHARYFLELSLAESGQCKEALPYLEKDYAHIADAQLKRTVGTDALRCATALDQVNKTLDFVRALNKDFPNDPDVLYLSSHVYSDLSTNASQRLLETAPGSYQAHQLNAEVLELQGKMSEAIEEYRKVLSLNRHAAEIHYRLGRLLLSDPSGAGALEKARQEFEEELKVNPGNASAEYELGEMARQVRQWNDAIEHFERASKLDPDSGEALIGLGKSLVSAGRAPEAVAPLETAVKLEPENPVTHYQLAFVYRRLGREAEAARELAAYRQTENQLRQRREAIRAGILGRMTDPQTAQPPE
jgi:tetratricopeptide (TPR) repeat protein